MPNSTRRALCVATALAPLAGLPLTSRAAAFPSRPLRIVVPYPGGDGTDVITRVLALQISKDLGVPTVIENRIGAAGLAGALYTANTPADGYTICMMVSGHITHQTLYKRFDLLKQFTPIANLATAPFAILVPPDSPYLTLADLLTAIRANPGKLTMATGGLGSPAHMAFEVFRTSLPAPLDINHIPYKSGLESTLAVVSKQTDFASAYIGSVLPLAQEKKVRVLAVTSGQRIAQIPDVPTIQESGSPGWEYNTLFFYAAPRKTPPEIVNALHHAIEKASSSPELANILNTLGHQLKLSASPAALENQLRAAIAAENQLIQERNMQVAL